MSSIAPGILAACDRVKPAVAITNPTSGSNQTGTITVSASASDNDQIAGVKFYLDGAQYGAEDTAAPYSFALNTATLSSGGHSIYAIARDRVGNTTQTPTVNFTVADQHPPTVSIYSPGSGATVSGVITLGCSPSDDVGISYVQFNTDGQGWTGAIGSPWQLGGYDTHNLANGAHTMYCLATDTAGNQTQTQVTFYVNNQPPGGGYLNFGDFVLDGVIDRTYVENWDNRFNQNWWWSGTGSKFGQLGLPGNPDPGNYQMQISWSGSYESAVPGTNYLDFQINNGGIIRPYANGFNGVWYNVNGGESIYCYRWSDTPDAAITVGIHCDYRFVVRKGS